ncbi:MAG: hybrid sensor histidine kinase/response regulator [Desulfobacter sp.]|nr:MAG: hybrid sensor histidine kinase/response regulator [Desulfobacter sp.]
MDTNHGGVHMVQKNTILVVDDDQVNIEILVGTLGDSYEVSVAMDGQSALEIINEIMPDIILLDIMMPGMDGYEVCRRVKENRATRNAMVLFVTALADAVDETYGFELGAVDYITKPFSSSVIRARIKTHLELAAARKELEIQNEILKENIRLREQVDHITRHDLKNPVQAIMSAAEIIRLHLPAKDPEDLEEMIQIQLKSCRNILNMVNRCLDVYKMEDKSYKLDAKRTDLLYLMDQVLMEGEEIIRSKGLELLIEINGYPRKQEDRFELICDELLFYSMMGNLVKNALEASPKKEQVKIMIQDTKGLSIGVENKGAVNPSIRSCFFEKFVTADKPKGTGIGTYSARLAAEMHGADIQLFTSDEDNITKVDIRWEKKPRLSSQQSDSNTD